MKKERKNPRGSSDMTERRHGLANIDMFFDLIRKIETEPIISEALHNKQLCLLPDDNPELAEANLMRINRQNLSPEVIVYLEASKSEGSSHYDIFVIKEPPIRL